MRRWIFRLHLWLAVVAGGFFLVLGLTGCVITFELPLDHWLHARLSYVSASTHYLPLKDILASVRASYPQDDIVAVSFSDSPILAWQVTIPAGIVCINPHTGQILGLRERGETILGFARDLHVSLAAGSLGRTAIRWCDLAALVLLISGLTLWWPKRTLRMHRFDSSRRSWSEAHNAIGVLSLAFLFVAAGTGALISFENPLRNVFRSFTGPEPARSVPLSPTPQKEPFLPPDRALVLASAALRGYQPAQMTMPEYGGTYTFLMTESRRFSAGAERTVRLDPWSGKVLDISEPTSPFLTDRLVTANEELHTGAIFGWPGRILMAIASLMLLPQALSGLVMFWKRTRKSEGRRTYRVQKGSLL